VRGRLSEGGGYGKGVQSEYSTEIVNTRIKEPKPHWFGGNSGVKKSVFPRLKKPKKKKSKETRGGEGHPAIL